MQVKIRVFSFVCLVALSQFCNAYVYISSPTDLSQINSNLDGRYVLTNDIDLQGIDYEQAVIGSYDDPFTGDFEGGGFVIRNLAINSTSQDSGLFAHIAYGGTVSNLGITNANVSGTQNVGILAGQTGTDSSIFNCFATGSVSGTGDNIGGLIGNAKGRIVDSYSTATVEGVNYVGGIAGHKTGLNLFDSIYSIGQVGGEGFVGGLVGQSDPQGRSYVDFNGHVDHIMLSEPLPIFNSSFTLEMWVFFNDDGRHVLLGDWGVGGGINTNFEKHYDGMLRVLWGGTGRQLRTDSKVVTPSRWHHIAFQRDKAGDVFRIFVDGELVNYFEDSGNDLTASIPHFIGRDTRTSTHEHAGDTHTPLDGRISDIRIWDYAREKAEIQADMYYQLSGDEAGLIGYWKLDELDGGMAYDISQSENHGYRLPMTPDFAGSANHGFKWSANSVEIEGMHFTSAVEFDGVWDHIQLSNPISVFDKSFTIEMWAYFYDDSRAQLLGDWDLRDRLGINFEKHTSRRLRILWDGLGHPDHFTSNNVVDLNTWHHLAVQRDKGADKFRIFVDGQVVGSFDGAGADLTAKAPHYLGRDGRRGATAFHGMMSDVRIWDYVRTESEIQADMNLRLSGDEDGLCYYWKLSSADTMHDLAWNHADLVANSFWDVESSGHEGSSGGVGKTSSEMRDIDTYLAAGWDFENTWHMLSEGYPILSWQALFADLTNTGVIDSGDLALLAADWIKDIKDIPEIPNLVISNPYEDVDWSTYGQYKAQLHTHTTESDGHETPQYVIDAYSSLGYDILSITDHDTMGPGTDPIEEPTWPWTDYGRDPDALGMLAIQGNEITRPHHILSYFSDYGDASESMTESAVEAIGQTGGLAVMAHPHWHGHAGGRGLPSGMQWTADVYAQFFSEHEHLVGIEVYNYLTREHHADDEELWDNVLTLLMPERPVFGYANDDSHRASDIGFTSNIFLLSDLNEAEFRQAMETGNFYFSYSLEQDGSAPVINAINVDETSAKITVDASDYDEIIWISRGNAVGHGSTLVIQGVAINDYVRAKLKSEYGVTYTQPFGVFNPCAYVHEHGLNYPGDLTRDCHVNTGDLEILINYWLDNVWD